MSTIDCVVLPSHTRVDDIRPLLDALQKYAPRISVLDTMECEDIRFGHTGARHEYRGCAVVVLNGVIPQAKRKQFTGLVHRYDPYAFLIESTPADGSCTALHPDEREVGHTAPLLRVPELVTDDTRLYW